MKYGKVAIIYRLTGVLIIAALLIWAMIVEEISAAPYNMQGLPRTFVISPNGNIARPQFGKLDPTEFEAWLVAAMK